MLMFHRTEVDLTGIKLSFGLLPGEMCFGFIEHLRIELGERFVQTEGVFCAIVLVLLASRDQIWNPKQLPDEKR